MPRVVPFLPPIVPFRFRLADAPLGNRYGTARAHNGTCREGTTLSAGSAAV